MKQTRRSVSLRTLCALFLLTIAGFTQDLNNLTKAEYKEFAREMIKEYKKDFRATSDNAKQIIIGMSGFEARPEAQKVFNVDAVFNLNSLLLLVAHANKIKHDKEFIEEYQKEAAGVAQKLTGEALVTCQVFVAKLIEENAKLP